MEINKQLFEDILSGKLKGIFALRYGGTIDTLLLHRTSCPSHPYTFGVNGPLYDDNGNSNRSKIASYDDLIDFMPDTNKLTIEIPDGKIVDWDESKKQNKIVLKDKQLTYEEICDKLEGMIDIPLFNTPSEDGNALVANEHYLECFLAKNKLATVAKYFNNGWKPTKGTHTFAITYSGNNFDNKPIVGEYYFGNGENLILFKTQKSAQQAIEILGEETIKLALEPLGI